MYCHSQSPAVLAWKEFFHFRVSESVILCHHDSIRLSYDPEQSLLTRISELEAYNRRELHRNQFGFRASTCSFVFNGIYGQYTIVTY